MVETAFVLGAGLGKRLRPFTECVPKPLLPVGGRPLIAGIFDRLVSLGVRRILVNTHHRAERYAEWFAEGNWKGVPLIFVYEPVLLDTAGGLKNVARHWVDDAPLLLHNGDVFSTVDLSYLVRKHVELREVRRVLCTLGLRSKELPRQVRWEPQEGVVRGFGVEGQPRPQEQDVLYAGLCVVEKEFLDWIPEGKAVGLVEVWKEVLASGGVLGGVLCDAGEWADIGTPQAYEQLCQWLSRSAS